MLKISIPEYRKVERHDKSYIVYCININYDGKFSTLQKRYSEIEAVHQKLRKIMVVPEFPPKKVLKWNPKVLEQRRQGLEFYLKGLVYHGSVPRLLGRFLELDTMGSNESLDQLDGPSITHQPILAFKKDPYLVDATRGGLPDIVTSGVLQGLYGT